MKGLHELGDLVLEDDFDLGGYVADRMAEAYLKLPEVRREEARILYGKRAVKQPASKHTVARRIKRRARKG